MRLFQATSEAPIVTAQILCIDEQAKALAEGQRGHVGRLLLFELGIGHNEQAHGLELFEGGFVEHGDSRFLHGLLVVFRATHVVVLERCAFG